MQRKVSPSFLYERAFPVPSLPTFSVRPLEDSMVGLGLCPIPRMAQHHLSQWCPPTRGVDCGNLWGLLNLPILHLLQFRLRPAAAVSSVWHMTLLSPSQRGPWPCSPPTILNLLPPPNTLERQCRGGAALSPEENRERWRAKRARQIQGSVTQGQKVKARTTSLTPTEMGTLSHPCTHVTLASAH